MNQTLSGEKNRKILVYHPAWAYLCRDYGLIQISIEENGKEPTPQGMVSLIDQARNDNIKSIFISPQFSRKSAESVAGEIGGHVVIVDDMDKNYIDNLNRVTDAFKNALT
ncbi:MAG: metal ABC transporter solute-binding protein, Zn/Mn family [Methanobacterium sp.]